MKRARFLDPREVGEPPIADSVNIPLSELASRVSELPPKEETVLVAAEPGLAERAVRVLEELGRRGEVVGLEFGPPGERLWEPNAFLLEVIGELPVGRALDLGCGGGRDAVYLASLGWVVCAVDRLPDCLERGRELERRYLGGSQIKWLAADVLGPGFEPGRFDLVLNFFFFDRGLLSRATRWLAPGGSLLVEAFTTVRQAREGKPSSPERVVGVGELGGLVDGLEVVRLDEGKHARGHTARLWARER